MTNHYPESQRNPSHEENLSELLGLIKDGFVPRENIHIEAPDEPNLNSLEKHFMSFYKDGSGANYVGFPDSGLISELLIRGLVSWHIMPHPSNRSCKVRYYELTA